MGRSKRIIIAAALPLIVWLAAAPFLPGLLIVEKAVEQPDAIIVLGGGASYLERTGLAARLFAAGTAPRIVLTNDGLRGGWDREEQRNPFYWELARRDLVASGVPESAITLLPGVVESTRDEALLLSARSGELGLRRVLIVTSPHHTRRALGAFERAASGRIEFGIGSPESDFGAFWWLTRRGLSRIGLEYVKLGWYSISF